MWRRAGSRPRASARPTRSRPTTRPRDARRTGAWSSYRRTDDHLIVVRESGAESDSLHREAGAESDSLRARSRFGPSRSGQGQRAGLPRPDHRTAAIRRAGRALPPGSPHATVVAVSSLGQALALAPDVRAGLTSGVSAFGQRTRERGARYARDGRVASLTLGDGAIDAVVQGEAPYRVHWERAPHGERGPWIARCSCPVGIFCKHAYAVAALLLGEAVAGALDDAPTDLVRRAPAPVPA
ncbi:MAG: hypothetical protein FJ148_12305, partial [Deltaproteobacteria bacterium]|nr:hypothetical protein [Deltaproteobacteria bacterium]